MNTTTNFNDTLPAEALRSLVDRHGLWRVLGAISAVALSSPRRVTTKRVEDLSDHLRRDIGLPPQTGGPSMWDTRT